MTTETANVKLLAATGMIGTGFAEASFERALAWHPDVIGCDAGSSDPGPYYLATGQTMVSRAASKRDLSIIIKGALRLNIPVLIGSAGTGGSNAQVDWTVDIVREIAREHQLSFKMAFIYAELEPERLADYCRRGKVKPLGYASELQEADIRKLGTIVGQMGPHPFIRALEGGAQVVIAGRASDTSIYTAVPIMRGLDNGPAWHAAKILECGAGSVEQRSHPDCMFAWVGEDAFEVEPPNPGMRCTPVSVVSHSLYENADPFLLYEPSGLLDTTDSQYEAVNERRVRVTGSRYKHSGSYTIRLEGVESLGYRRTCIAGVRDPIVLRQLPQFLDEAAVSVKKKTKESLGIAESEYAFNYRVYGDTGTMAELEPMKGNIGHEVGVLMEVVAADREAAAAIMKIAWHTVLHHPVKEWSGLVSNLAFPFSPPDADMGEAFRFALNHIVEVADPCELVDIHYLDV